MNLYECNICNKTLNAAQVNNFGDIMYCDKCWKQKNVKPYEFKELEDKQYNEPQHYHQHNIDTIKFLQEGFPPDVFMGFAIGHIIKYAQRANYKNGREDFVKMVDYSKRALDWYDKTHS